MDDKLKEKLLKLYELVKRGVDGEKQNAEVLLNKLLLKHGFTLEDINQDIPKDRYYKYTTLFSRIILQQVIIKVTNGRDVYGLKKYKEITCKVSDYEHVQILEMSDFHLENAEKEKKQLIDDLSKAYVQKHKLYRIGPVDESERKPLTLEEKQALFRMMNLKDNLSNVSYTKKIE